MHRSPTREELANCALLVIDMQRGFEDPRRGPRNNPNCEANVARLVESWRRNGRPMVFVRHHSSPDLEPDHPFSTADGRRFKTILTGRPDLLVTKSVHSAFYGRPSLDRWLKKHQIPAVAICGITTDHCCSTTARNASDLGYRMYFVLDATHTFDRTLGDGRHAPAAEVALWAAASLDGEFGTVVNTSDLLQVR
jgi:nicotinamidase-related amidase